MVPARCLLLFLSEIKQWRMTVWTVFSAWWSLIIVKPSRLWAMHSVLEKICRKLVNIGSKHNSSRVIYSNSLQWLFYLYIRTNLKLSRNMLNKLSYLDPTNREDSQIDWLIDWSIMFFIPLLRIFSLIWRRHRQPVLMSAIKGSRSIKSSSLWHEDFHSMSMRVTNYNSA